MDDAGVEVPGAPERGRIDDYVVAAAFWSMGVPALSGTHMRSPAKIEQPRSRQNESTGKK